MLTARTAGNGTVIMPPISTAIPTGTCGEGIYKKQQMPIVLAYTNATAAAVVVKMQSADDVVESAQGTQGAASFTVNRLLDRAGLAVGAVQLNGIDALRKRLLVYMFNVSNINYQATTSAQLSNPIVLKRGEIDGTVAETTFEVGQYQNNQQYVQTLQSIPGPIYLTSNTLIQLSVDANTSVKLTMVGAQEPYNRVF